MFEAILIAVHQLDLNKEMIGHPILLFPLRITLCFLNNAYMSETFIPDERTFLT